MEIINKRKAFEKKIDKKLSEYVSSIVKKEYKKNETFLAIQDKIKKIENYGFVKDCFKDIVENKRKVVLYCDYDND
jgi:hypothetical protein